MSPLIRKSLFLSLSEEIKVGKYDIEENGPQLDAIRGRLRKKKEGNKENELA